jgi:hypothetical protein
MTDGAVYIANILASSVWPMFLLLLAVPVGVLAVWIVSDVVQYKKYRWKKHVLSDNDWRRLCMHLQMQRKLEQDRMEDY